MYFVILEAASEVPAEIRPNRTLEFDEVIPISAKTNPDDVINLKYELRKFIDLNACDNFEEQEQRFIKSIEWKLKEYGPRMA